MARSQRVSLMVENFYQDFQSGMSLPEIEENYGVSKGYAYRLLDEIATNNGIDPEEFYQVIHGPHVMTDKNGRIIPPKRYSDEELDKLFEEAEFILNEVTNSLNEMLHAMTAVLKEWDHEFCDDEKMEV